MKIRYFFICLGLFPNFHANAQIAKFIKEGIEFFSKSASKNELPDIVEHLSTKSLSQEQK